MNLKKSCIINGLTSPNQTGQIVALHGPHTYDTRDVRRDVLMFRRCVYIYLFPLCLFSRTLLAFVPCLLLFFFFSFFSYSFLHPGMFIFFVFLRLRSSHLILSVSTSSIVRVLSACVICTLPHPGILLFFIRSFFFFRSSYCSGGVFSCCALVPGTLALDLPTLIL